MAEETQENSQIDKLLNSEYKLGFSTDIESDTVPPGLNEDVITFISHKKEEPQWGLDLRLQAYKKWQNMKEPHWAHLTYDSIDYNSISYFSAPKKTPDSLDEVDPKILETYEKLGIPLEEQKMLQGIAVDAVFDSVSVKTTFSDTLSELGIIFCSISEAMRDYPELVQKYLYSVVPMTDNFYATLNSAVFTWNFCVYSKRCKMPYGTFNIF